MASLANAASKMPANLLSRGPALGHQVPVPAQDRGRAEDPL